MPGTSKVRGISETITTTMNNKIEVREFNFYYGGFQALIDLNMGILENQITALIGPSGCGKSTFLRSINRMNDTIDIARAEGEIFLDGENVYDPGVDVVELRQRIGMVFQRPNPFPQSIYDNVAYGPRVLGMSKNPLIGTGYQNNSGIKASLHFYCTYPHR